MLNLPDQILHILALFSPLFSKPVYKNVVQLFIGHTLTKGRRTTADVLRTLGLHNLKNYHKFHWVLSGAKWGALKASQILLTEIINMFVPEEIVIPLDTHVERRKGEKIKGLGRQRDAVRSTKNRKVLTIGLLWLVASIAIKLPGCTTHWALPFFAQLIPPKNPLSTSRNQSDLKGKSRRKTLTEYTVQLVKAIRTWLDKGIRFVIVGDTAFACHKIAHTCANLGGALVSKMRIDSRIFHFPDQNKKRKGKPLLVGKRCPLFSDYLTDPNINWKESIVNWYSGKKKKVLVYTGVNLWYAYGIPPLPIRWVLVKDPTGEIAPVVLFSTYTEHSPERIIEIFVSRWPIEVTFEESRRHLGVETQRQWSDKAIVRTTPCILCSFSIIVLMAMRIALEKEEKISPQKAAWYHKTHLTFSDMLSYVRMAILRKKYSKFGIKLELGKKDLEDLILRAASA